MCIVIIVIISCPVSFLIKPFFDLTKRFRHKSKYLNHRRLSLKRGFGGCGHRFDELGEFGGCNGLGGFNGFSGFGGFSGFSVFDG